MAAFLLLLALVLSTGDWVAPTARAGDTYVLDIVRAPTPPTSEPGIVRLDSLFGQTRLTLSAGPGVELPLHEPVGIDVDETSHMLYVTDAGGNGGYPGMTDFGPCNGGCGAVLKIDPVTGATTVLAGPSDPNNMLENPYGILVRPDVGDALVADQGTTRIISVNLATGAQRVFNQGARYADGLRGPWGLARDPTNGDILVANAGVDPSNPDCAAASVPCPLDSAEFNFPLPAACTTPDILSHGYGYVLRLSSTGEQKQIYCDPQFRRPRDVLVNGDGTIFVVDPFSFAVNPKVTPSSQVGFGTVFTVDPNTGSTEGLAAGGSMATPSGIDFDYAGTGLLIADETLYPFAGPCLDGCGGVIDLNAADAEQAVVSSRGPSGNTYVDPIAIAADRDGRPAPTLRVKAVPPFLDNVDRPEGAPTVSGGGITVLPFFPVLGGSRVKVDCLGRTCRHKRKRGKKPIREKTLAQAKVPHGQVVYRMGLKHPLGQHKRNRYRAIAVKHGLKGRYQDFKVIKTGGTVGVKLLNSSGCLRPGASKIVRRGRHKTVVKCPRT